MELEQARQLLRIQADFGGSYNRRSAQLVLAEVGRGHGQRAVDRLIREFRLQAVFGFEPGSSFKAP